MSSPCIAYREVDIATTSGIATPKACGQEVTMTVTIRSSAKDNSRPRPNHVIKVIMPTLMETMISHMATLPARFCVLDLALWADCTMLITLLR